MECNAECPEKIIGLDMDRGISKGLKTYLIKEFIKALVPHVEGNNFNFNEKHGEVLLNAVVALVDDAMTLGREEDHQDIIPSAKVNKYSQYHY